MKPGKSSKRKKATGKPRRRAGRTSLLSRLLRMALLAFGVALGLLIPWTLYLDHQVRTEFEGRKWDLPSRVYARPLELYPGLLIDPRMLRAELAAAGYAEVDPVTRPGQFAARGQAFTIYRREFRFPDGSEPDRLIAVSLAGDRIAAVRDSESRAPLDLARLDPAEIATIYPLHKEDRTLVRLQEVPQLLVTGLQAVEDRNFKHHHGIDPRGIARAALANIRAGRAVQGGSTLTQQLVKNYFLNADRTLLRKINEALMSGLLEWHYDKSEILEAYINEVFLGQQGATAIHGFARGARFYFDQPLERLDEAQIALLIGVVKGPSHYNPRRQPERAMKRRNDVIGMMADTGLLSPGQAAEAVGRPLGVTAQPAGTGLRYAAFIDLVRRQLAHEFAENDLRTEGLRIFTTLAPSEQELAQEAVSRGLAELERGGLSPTLEGALVLADVSSGEVRALVGGRHPNRAGYNRALNARRQVGSVIKPLIYLLALEHQADYSLLTPLEDAPLSLRQPDGSHWSPANYDEVSHGRVSVLEALTMSYNQATVRLGLNIGVTPLLHRIEQLGVDAAIDPVPSVFLGAAEMTPLEVAQLYQPLAANGYSVPLRAVVAVETPEGDALTRYPLRLTPLTRRDAVAVLNYALTRVVAEGTANALPGLLGKDAVIAGKTGTTNDRRDSWFVGYTRNRMAVSWVGEDDNRPAGVSGSNAAMRLWARLFRGLPVESVELRMPDGAHWAWVDELSGALSAQECDGARQLPFIEGSEPRRHTPCLERQLARQEKDESFWRKWFGKEEN